MEKAIRLAETRTRTTCFNRFSTSIACISAATVLFAVASAAPAGAAIRVVGSSPRADLWKSLYDRLPVSWQSKNDVVVREVSDMEMDRLVAEDEQDQGPAGKNDDSVVDGYYHEGSRNSSEAPTITLRRSMPEDEAAFVFTHEYGHFVWYKKLSSDQRAEYTRIWRQLKRNCGLITRYAGDCVEEGFAEAFAYYVRKPARLRSNDPRSYKFLTDIKEALNKPSTK